MTGCSCPLPRDKRLTVAPLSSSPSPTLANSISCHIRTRASVTSGKQNAEIYLPHQHFFPWYSLIPPGIQGGENARRKNVSWSFSLHNDSCIQSLCDSSLARLRCSVPVCWRSRRSLVRFSARKLHIYLALIECQHSEGLGEGLRLELQDLLSMRMSWRVLSAEIPDRDGMELTSWLQRQRGFPAGE